MPGNGSNQYGPKSQSSLTQSCCSLSPFFAVEFTPDLKKILQGYADRGILAYKDISDELQFEHPDHPVMS